MNKIKSKKRINMKVFAALFYVFGVFCICAGVLGATSTQATSFKSNEADNINLNKTVSTKDLMSSYQKITKKLEEEARAKAAAKAKAEALEQAKEAANIVSSASYSKSEYLAYAYDLVINQYGWTQDDYNSLVHLWNRESGWNANSHSGTGAHGIPQALPASKMSSEGSDYYSNGKTQIRWGLKYIKNKYGNASSAWAFFQNNGWY